MAESLLGEGAGELEEYLTPLFFYAETPVNLNPTARIDIKLLEIRQKIIDKAFIKPYNKDDIK